MADIQDISAWLSGARGWQTVLASGLAVLTAATTTVALHAPDPASADTFVSVAREAQVFLPDGTDHTAAEGERLPRGARVQTGAEGGVQLRTAGRTVYVGALSTLTVTDGVRQTLARGLAMVDARRGARLDLSTPAGVVSSAAGSVVRVEESPLQRIAVFDGKATLHVVGRSATATVTALHQVRVQPGSLPQRTTALVLRSDAWERSVAADLVAADAELTTLASGLGDATGQTFLTAAPASLRSTTVPAPGAARGEEALTVALAAAAADPSTALSEVRADRADNGSWGVVAALVGASVNDVSAVLNAALAPLPADTSGSTSNAGRTPLPGVLPTGSPSPGSTTGRPTTGPTGKPTATPTPTVTPSESPGLVTTLVDTVLGLLPTPKAATVPTTPTPSPTPGLLGGLLGGK